MSTYREPIFSWNKLLTWRTVMFFVVAVGGFSLGYYTQTFFHNRQANTQVVSTVSGRPPSDANDDPYIIDFTHQGLLEFPNFLLERSEITNLILSDNSIFNLPEEITKIERLRVLDMRYNNLNGSLTPAIARLELVDVNFSHNQLTTLPEQLGRMSSLRYFDVSYNRITDLPDSIINLQDLKWLNLVGNNINQDRIDDLRQQMPSTIINR